MNKTLEEALDEITYEASYKRKQNVRRLAKIHKLKRENRVLSARRKTVLQCKQHYNSAKYHYYCAEDFSKLFHISEQIGKNSAKIQRLRTLISQNK